MNYKIIEKVLIPSTIDRINKLRFSKQKEKPNQSGYLYTSYRGYDERIIIGFTSSIEDLITSQRLVGFNLVGKRNGVKDDERILKDTLAELGYNQSQFNGSYKYSLVLLKHLEILGWPIEGIYRSPKDRIYNYKSKSKHTV